VHFIVGANRKKEEDHLATREEGEGHTAGEEKEGEYPTSP
jgi:hypothetical protein